MTRDDLRGIVEGITDAQLKSILDINSSDIGKAKTGLDEIQTQLDTANTRITELESALVDAEKVQKELNRLQKTVDDRDAEDAEREKQRRTEERFSSVAGETNFINELTRKGILSEFAAALDEDSNTGKSDAEIYEALTHNRDNLFAPEGGVPTVVSSTTFGGTSFTDNDVREIMGLPKN